MNSKQMQAWCVVLATLKGRQREVLKTVLGSHGRRSTAFKIAKHMGKPVHSISGRITELRKAGVLIDSGMTELSEVSGMKVTVWRVNPDAPKNTIKKIMEE